MKFWCVWRGNIAAAEDGAEDGRTPEAEGSDVIHLFFVRAFVEQLLEGDVVGCVFERLLQFFPRRAQFGRALRIADGRRIEHLPVNSPQEVAE